MGIGKRARRPGLQVISVGAAVLAVLLVLAPVSFGRVLRVGSYRGVRGQFKTIQGAVDAAKRGDWILVAPGDYHERGDRLHRPKGDVPPGGVLITTPSLHLRGMRRNKVIIDGTRPGSPVCSRKKSDQDFGVKKKGSRLGRNGIVVWKTSHVSVENLTTCNFLAASGENGNEIWWNGGDGSGKIGMGAWRGSYLNATSTFYRGVHTAAQYGFFASNARGPGLWAHDYGSNFADSNFYIGGCRRVCNSVVRRIWSEFSALGYSGTNSGGRIIVKHSEFDRNEDGFDTNSQNNDDWPSPQDGRCPHGKRSPITQSISCWVFMHNFVHDNNNPNVPAASIAGGGRSPVGTGVSISGGRFDTVMHNRIVDNGAWGLLLAPYPDDETPPPGQHCQGGTSDTITSAFGFTCTFDDWGNQIFDNTFDNNGFFGNPSNSDIGELTLIDGKPINCYRGNTVPDGTSPPGVQTTNANCGRVGTANNNLQVLTEAACDSQVAASLCMPTDRYPRARKVVMHSLPTKKLDSMPNPCRGVPANPWCPARQR